VLPGDLVAAAVVESEAAGVAVINFQAHVIMAASRAMARPLMA